jgi:macrodomain Ter protein organizer (MatP/YcbG family)
MEFRRNRSHWQVQDTVNISSCQKTNSDFNNKVTNLFNGKYQLYAFTIFFWVSVCYSNRFHILQKFKNAVRRRRKKILYLSFTICSELHSCIKYISLRYLKWEKVILEKQLRITSLVECKIKLLMFLLLDSRFGSPVQGRPSKFVLQGVGLCGSIWIW